MQKTACRPPMSLRKAEQLAFSSVADGIELMDYLSERQRATPRATAASEGQK